MADFRKALKALGGGRLDLLTLGASLDKLLSEQPQIAPSLLRMLDEAHAAGVIDDVQYRGLRELIESPVYQAAAGSLAQQRKPSVPDPLDTVVIAAPSAADTEADSLKAIVMPPPTPQAEADDGEATSYAPVTRAFAAASDADDDEQKTRYAPMQPRAVATAPVAPQPHESGFTQFELTNTLIYEAGAHEKPLTDISIPDISAHSTGTAPTISDATIDVAAPAGIGSVLLDRYELIEQIGRGGMGTVYKALDQLAAEAEERNPYLAVKILNEDFKLHPKAFTALQREAARQGQLRHPSICQVKNFERDRRLDVSFTLMELLEGMPLSRFIGGRRQRHEGGLSFAEAWPIVEALGKGLEHAHKHGFVHSDFKPGNCFLGKDGTAKVLDFGIAQAVPGSGFGRDGGGEITKFNAHDLGALTIPYASLEMLRGEVPVPRDDLYALALVAYELLTLTHPFGKKGAEEAFEKRMAPKPVQGLTSRQWAGLARGLAFERHNRQPDIETFLREFEGKVEAWKNPWIVAPALALALVIPGVILIDEALDRSRIKGITDGFVNPDLPPFEQALDKLAALDDDVRRLLVEQQLPVLEQQFEQRVSAMFDAHDFAGAEALLKRGSQLRSSWGVIADLRDVLKQSRAQRVLDLRESIESCAGDTACLAAPTGERSFAMLVEQLRALEPKDGLVAPAALATRYADAVKRLLKEASLDDAGEVLAAGLALAPADSQLTTLGDTLSQRRVALTAAQEVERLEREMAAALPGVTRLADAGAALSMIAELARRSPDAPALREATQVLAPLATKDLRAARDEGRWADLARQVNTLRASADALGLGEEIAAADTALAHFERDVAKAMEGLREAIAAQSLLGPAASSAMRRYERLSTLVGPGTRADEARELVSSALMREARKALSDGRFDEAGRYADAFSTLEGRADGEALVALREDLELARTAQAGAAAAKIAIARIERLEKQLDQGLAALSIKPASLLAVLGTLDELRTLNGRLDTPRAATDALLQGAPDRIGARLTEVIGAARTAGQFDDAIAMLDTVGTSGFDTGTALDALRGEIESARTTAEAQQAARQTAALKTDIDALIASASFDDAWQLKLDRAFAAAEADAALKNDAWLGDARGRLVQAAQTAFSRQVEGKNFDDARGLLARFERAPYVSVLDKNKRDTLGKALTDAEIAWKETQLAQELESRKADLRSLVEANKLTDARKRWDSLQKDLPANDAFAAEAKQIFANAYLALAQGSAAKEPAKALAFVAEGLRFTPESAPLAALQKELGAKAEAAMLNAIAEMSPADEQRTAGQYDTLRKGAPDGGKALAEAARARARKRLETLATGDPKTCAALAAAYASFLDGLAADLCPAPGPVVPAAFAEILGASRLSAARKLLDEVPAELHSDAAYAKAEADLLARRQLVDAALAQFDTATQQGDLAAAAAALAEARKFWIDRPANEWPTPVAIIEPQSPPAPLTSMGGGIACSTALAGKGVRAKAVCFDRAGDADGPPLVVVPAGGGIGAFAIGRYEISVGDYNRYCAKAGCTTLGGSADTPATGIGLDAAKAYLAWLSSQTGQRYRLPTSAEWTYAATGGKASRDKNFNCRLVVNGNVMKGQGVLSVRAGRPNAWGLYNAVGNVQEWSDGGKAHGGAYSDQIDKCSPTLEKDQGGSGDDLTGFRAVRDLG